MIYARFVDYVKDEEVYTVKFECDGEKYDDMKTIGGKVYDLPVPTKDGMIFAGWFISQYNDPAMLSYMYTGQVLAEDTVLYANFVDSATQPVIETVDEKGFTWKSVGINKNYTVNVTDADADVKVVENKTVAMTKYDYEFTAAGNYVIEVTVDG